MIERINRDFVSATLSYPFVWKLAESGNAVARRVIDHWSTPLVLIFLDSEGRFVTELSSLKALNEVHPDTTRRPEAPQFHSHESAQRNVRVFLEHLNKFFPDQGSEE